MSDGAVMPRDKTEGPSGHHRSSASNPPGEHVGPLVGDQRLLILAQRLGHLFEREDKFAGADELREQHDVFARQSVIQSD